MPKVKEQVVPESARASQQFCVDETAAPLVPEKRAIDALLQHLREINNLTYSNPSDDSHARIRRLSSRALMEARTVKDKLTRQKS